MDEVIDQLDDSEKARNVHSGHMLYEYIEDNLGVYTSFMPEAFPDIMNNHAQYVLYEPPCVYAPIWRLHLKWNPGRVISWYREWSLDQIWSPGSDIQVRWYLGKVECGLQVKYGLQVDIYVR